MKKRGIGLILAASSLAAVLPGAAQAAKKDDCPRGEWTIFSGTYILDDSAVRAGARPIDPASFYCVKVSRGHPNVEGDVLIVGPEVVFEL